MKAVDSVQVLETTQVNQKIKRMAYEIYEQQFASKGLVLAGINGQGFALAKTLAKILKEISQLEVEVIEIQIDKENPNPAEVRIKSDDFKFRKRPVVIVDDVLNTGKTLLYASQLFLNPLIPSVEIAVLVNRSQTRFPVYPRYTGYDLATTLNDHVRVVLGKQASVFLE
jgi:pyrimidine operon attenuation protein/uracil phosphoribosyltransferase